MKNKRNFKFTPLRRYFYFVIFPLFVLFVGCESMVNDLDEGKLPKTESKLTVESYIAPQAEDIRVKVTKSQPLFGPSTYTPTFVKNATVIISDGTREMRIPYNDSLSMYIAKADLFKIEAGKKYSLVVSDGERTVKASCTVPEQSVAIKTYSIDTVARNRYPGDTVLKIRASWDDVKGKSNYYSTRGYTVIEQTNYGYNPQTGKPEMIQNDNKMKLDYGTDSGLQNDTNLDGITFNSPVYEVQISNYTYSYSDPFGNKFSYNTNPRLKEFRFEILNVDENYYKFARSLRESNDNDNPFVEPALVYSNVEGGLGCFGAYNLSGVTVIY